MNLTFPVSLLLGFALDAHVCCPLVGNQIGSIGISNIWADRAAPRFQPIVNVHVITEAFFGYEALGWNAHWTDEGFFWKGKIGLVSATASIFRVQNP